MEEGSPLDAFVYFVLIAAGFCILYRGKSVFRKFFVTIGWLMAFLLYCFIAILWSDFPFVAFKRWIKILGHPDHGPHRLHGTGLLRQALTG